METTIVLTAQEAVAFESASARLSDANVLATEAERARAVHERLCGSAAQAAASAHSGLVIALEAIGRAHGLDVPLAGLKVGRKGGEVALAWSPEDPKPKDRKKK